MGVIFVVGCAINLVGPVASGIWDGGAFRFCFCFFCVCVGWWRIVFGLGGDDQLSWCFCLLSAYVYIWRLCRLCWRNTSDFGLGSGRVQCIV